MSWILTHVYEATKSPEHLRKAISIWEKEINSLDEETRANRIAELYWSIAKSQDLLGEYLDASESFEEASRFYKVTGEKTPEFSEFYQEYASYMEAWSEFEKGKQAHLEKNYSQAKDHYHKISEIYETTEQWNYLATNFRAWASLEEAEEYSKSENPQEAIQSFQKASDMFKKSKKEAQEKLVQINKQERETHDIVNRISKQLEEEDETLKIKPSSTKDTEEKTQLKKLIEASDQRREYCLGRKALEEALLLNKQGEKRESSRRYSRAAGIFEKIASKSEQTQQEIQPFVCLSKAWQNMTEAEILGSPEKYLEASQLFDQVKDQCSDERSKRLIQGHSFFCKALEAGARFEETRDQSLYKDAISNLGDASNLYLRAGFKGASEYAKATQRLFEAYVHIDSASKEMDPQKKARGYALAERLLEFSSRSYEKADYTDKSDEISRILQNVKDEREIAMSLGDILETTTVITPSDVYPVPMPTQENAVGLEKFENAELEAHLITDKKEYRVGERINLELEIMNTGNGTAQLIKIEEIIPEGFQLNSRPRASRVQGIHLNLRNKTLEPHKFEEYLLGFTPMKKGVYTLKPRIVYLDETDELEYHEVDPAEFIIKEFGIRDWLKGPKRKK